VRVAELFSMGNYGAYVWSAYTFVGLVFIIHAVATRVSRKKTIQTLKKDFEEDQ